MFFCFLDVQNRRSRSEQRRKTVMLTTFVTVKNFPDNFITLANIGHGIVNANVHFSCRTA